MEEKQIQIRAENEKLAGAYTNLMTIRHTKEEFCLDFINSFDPPILVSRVLTSPGHFKRMVRAMEDNLKKYEAQFGEIEIAEAPKASMGFTK